MYAHANGSILHVAHAGSCGGRCRAAAVQVDKEEVRLRRSIGLKKDEYQLNKKHVTYACFHLQLRCPAMY